MFQCSFELNDRPMSSVNVAGLAYPAFSGLGANINKRSAACLADQGPIPPGEYYIVDRESGGRLGPLWDRMTSRHEWFALYALDGVIDDRTFCNEVERGNFRLHPKGRLGRSTGCIVIANMAHYLHLYTVLKSAAASPIQGTRHKAYGKVVVR